METFTKDTLYKGDIVVYLNEGITSGTYKFIGQVVGFMNDKVRIRQLSKANQFVTPNECIDYREVSIYPTDVVHIIGSRYIK